MAAPELPPPERTASKRSSTLLTPSDQQISDPAALIIPNDDPECEAIIAALERGWQQHKDTPTAQQEEQR